MEFENKSKLSVIDCASSKTMQEDEMLEFIEKIGRAELYCELELIKSGKVFYNYPSYLKAVRVSLLSLGYDVGWVETIFSDALDSFYLKK